MANWSGYRDLINSQTERDRSLLRGDTPRRGERWEFISARSPDQKHNSSVTVDENPTYKLTVYTRKYDRNGNVRGSKVGEIHFDERDSVETALKGLGFSRPGRYSYSGAPGSDQDLFTDDVRISHAGIERRGRRGKYKPVGKFRRTNTRRR